MKWLGEDRRLSSFVGLGILVAVLFFLNKHIVFPCCAAIINTLPTTPHNEVYLHTLAYIITVFVIADLLLVLVPFWCIYHKQDD